MAVKYELSVPLMISGAIHVGVIIFLIAGVNFDEKPKHITPAPSAPAVQAIVIDQKKVDERVARIKQQREDEARKEKARQDELDRRAREATKARELEQKKIKQLEAQRKQKEIETKRANDAAKAAQLKQKQEREKAAKAESLRKQKEHEKKLAEQAAAKAAQKRKAEEAAAKKAEQERKRKAEEERKRKAAAQAKAQQEREMAEAMAAEQTALSKTRNKQVLSEVGKYQAMIQATIQRYIVFDSSMQGKSCRVFLRLARDGFVTASQTLDGDQVVCRAAKAAINKVGKLPMSAEPDVYEKLKEINLIVSPEIGH
ncbi:cell envelope integrity protein TolA [Shewanella intestini]|nr:MULTISPECIES: cell envelope integrity protein TolA [Shewanella]